MGQILPNPSDVPVSQVDDWVPLLNRDAAGYSGMRGVQLTNWDETTNQPAIMAGSKLDVIGSIASFPIDEAIAQGLAIDGTVYVRLVVVDQVVTAEFTNQAPVFDTANNGYYFDGMRYTGHYMTKAGTLYSAKFQGTNELNGFNYGQSPNGFFSSAGIMTDNFQLKQKLLTGTRAGFASGVAHGLDMSKIICANASAQYSNGLWYGFPRDETYNNGINWNTSTVIVEGINTGYTAMKVLLWYEA